MQAFFASPAGDAAQIFLAVMLAFICVSMLWEVIRRVRQERRIARKLENISRQAGGGTATAKLDPLFQLEDDTSDDVSILTRLIPRQADLQRQLERADADWGVGTFILLTLGLTAAGGLGTSIVMAGPIAPLVAAMAAGSLPYLHLRRLQVKRALAFEEHFPEAIELLSRSLRAGHALLTGLEVVAEESPAPVNKEFRQVYEQQRFGLPLEESLLGLADRINSVDVRMFVTSVLIQRESGGNLAEILDNLASLIRERFKFARQLRVHTAQGRLTGYLLAVLPVAVGLALFAITRDYMMVLITEPGGRMMLMAMAVMQVLGFLWIRKIVDIEF